MSARAAAAISEHPVPAQAVGEIAGQLLDELDGRPVDLMTVFCSPHLAGAVDDVTAVLRTVLAPRALIGSTHTAVVGTGREVEDTPAISVWALSDDRVRTDVVALDVVATDDGRSELVGWPAPGDHVRELAPDVHTLVLLADPFTFPVDGVLDVLRVAQPELAVVGGLASAANAPGGNRLVVDDRVITHGAVGVFLGWAAPVTTVVAQGCRPVGAPFTVTAVDGNHVVELGGRPPLARLQELAATMDDAAREQLQRGLHFGIAFDEHRSEFGRGDFLVRSVLGARASDGAIAVGANVEVGQTLQFQVRDAAAADEDLRLSLAGQHASAALLFTCTGRGRRLFGVPHHDAAAVGDAFGPVPLAGGFCAGELGPVAGVNHAHGFTASLALFD